MGRLGGMISVVFLIAIFILPGTGPASAYRAEQATAIGGTNNWSFTNDPAYFQICRPGCVPGGFQVTLTNNLSMNVTGVVYMVVQNGRRQTVGISSSGLTLAPGSTGTAVIPAPTVPSGTYIAWFFVTTPGQVAISPVANQTLTI